MEQLAQFWRLLLSLLLVGSAESIYSWFKPNLFRCAFVDHDPPEESEFPASDFHDTALGNSQHWLKLVTSQGFNLGEVNIRFLSFEEALKDPKDGNPENIESTVSISAISLTPEIITQKIEVIPSDDRYGGIDVKFIPPYPWGTGRALFLRVDVDAKKAWLGNISARINDKELNPHVARARVRLK